MVRYLDNSEAIALIGLAHNNGQRIEPTDLTPVLASVNHGRWVAFCLSPGCRMATLVRPDRPFFCPACGGPQHPVIFPPDRVDIDAVLDCRPDPASQNWSPDQPVPGRGIIGERLDDLLVENLERGLPVPPLLHHRAVAFLEADWRARGLWDEMQPYVKAAS